MVNPLILEDGLELDELSATPATPASGSRALVPMNNDSWRDIDDTGATQDYYPQEFEKRIHHLSLMTPRIIEGSYQLGASGTGYGYFSNIVNASQSFRFYTVPLQYWLAGAVEWLVPLAAGDWRLYVKHVRSNNAANAQFFIDGDLIGGALGYASSTTYELSAQIRFNLERSGVRRLSMKTTSQPASADNYFVLTRLYLVHEDELPA